MSSLGKHTRYLPVLATPTREVTGTLRISAVWHLPSLLREIEADLDEVLVAAGLPLKIFGDPDNPITYPELEQLLLACERHSNRDDFGLLIGQRSASRKWDWLAQQRAAATTWGKACVALSSNSICTTAPRRWHW